MWNNRIINADILGASAGTLCLIHCLSTPFIFTVKACSTSCCADTPIWWYWIDLGFLFISFFAIFQTTKTSAKTWIKNAMWASWVLLLVIILNEYIQAISLPQTTIYLPAITLIILHFYNLKYCPCSDGECAVGHSTYQD